MSDTSTGAALDLAQLREGWWPVICLGTAGSLAVAVVAGSIDPGPEVGAAIGAAVVAAALRPKAMPILAVLGLAAVVACLAIDEPAAVGGAVVGAALVLAATTERSERLHSFAVAAGALAVVVALRQGGFGSVTGPFDGGWTHVAAAGGILAAAHLHPRVGRTSPLLPIVAAPTIVIGATAARGTTLLLAAAALAVLLGAAGQPAASLAVAGIAAAADPSTAPAAPMLLIGAATMATVPGPVAAIAAAPGAAAVLGALAGRHATAAAVLVAALAAALACIARQPSATDGATDPWRIGLPHIAGAALGVALVVVPDRLSWGAPAVGSWLSSFLPAIAGAALAVVGVRAREAARVPVRQGDA